MHPQWQWRRLEKKRDRRRQQAHQRDLCNGEWTCVLCRKIIIAIWHSWRWTRVKHQEGSFTLTQQKCATLMATRCGSATTTTTTTTESAFNCTISKNTKTRVELTAGDGFVNRCLMHLNISIHIHKHTHTHFKTFVYVGKLHFRFPDGEHALSHWLWYEGSLPFARATAQQAYI